MRPLRKEDIVLHIRAGREGLELNSVRSAIRGLKKDIQKQAFNGESEHWENHWLNKTINNWLGAIEKRGETMNEKDLIDWVEMNLVVPFEGTLQSSNKEAINVHQQITTHLRDKIDELRKKEEQLSAKEAKP